MEPTSRLADIAGNTYFVLGAYFFAFFPWAVMNSIDFISEKWRTIGRTRKLAYIHMASSLVPLVYVAVYAEAQRQAKDDKELGAAMAALLFNVVQFLRTVMGKVQLEAFVRWCKHGVECMRALQGADDGGVERSERSHGRLSTEAIKAEVVDDVEKKVRINNSVVDNELGGTDITVVPSWRKIWNGIKKLEFEPSKWLVTDQARLCIVRWGGAYLSGISENWGVTERRPGEAVKKLAEFFENDMDVARSCLQSVTWDVGEGDGEIELLSINGIGDSCSRITLNCDTTTPYGSQIHCFWANNTSTVDCYSFEFDSLVGSYPATSNDEFIRGNREKVTVGLVHSVVLAKYLGVQKLKAIRRYYERYRMCDEKIFRNAFQLLLKQIGSPLWKDSERWKYFSYGSDMPMFPYRMQMIALWEQSTNWRVLQASAHREIEDSLSIGDFVQNQLILRKRPTVNVFDYFMDTAQEMFEKREETGVLGVAIETVRSFLAEWLVSGVREPNWEPIIPEESFEFGIIDIGLHDGNIRSKHRLIWICQQALQKEVAKTSIDHQNLPSSHVLIMLFLMGAPGLRVAEVSVAQNDTLDGDEHLSDIGVKESSLSRPGAYQSVEMSVQEFRVLTCLAPQHISLLIRVESEASRISIRIQNHSDDARFMWQDWVDAVMGFMKGYDKRAYGKMKYERAIVRANLQRPMMELCPIGKIQPKETASKTNTTRIWMGWPPFDTSICKFEIEQWLKAYNTNTSTDFNLIIEDCRELHIGERIIETIISANEL